MKLEQFDNQCEDRCMVGIYSSIEGINGLIYDGLEDTFGKNDRVVLFNFCPACGQEMELEKIETKEGTVFRRKTNE